MKNTIIYFTKIPARGFGKYRLNNFMNEEQRYQLNKSLILTNYDLLRNSGHNLVVYYEKLENSNSNEDIFDSPMKKQMGGNLGQRMFNAIKYELNEADKVLLIGSDLVNLSKELIDACFDKLDKTDVVITPSNDGGYGIIGMNKIVDAFSDITYSNEEVVNNTIEKIKSQSFDYSLVGQVRDLDTREDLVREELGTDKFEVLGFGEYNLNYKYLDKDNNSRVYRINLNSQMNLGQGQIEYEFNALKELENTGVVPRVYLYNLSSKYIPYGNLIMEFLEGRPLNYDTDLKIAAELLAKIHNHKVVKDTFIHADKPFKAMYEEFVAMFSHYKNWSMKDDKVEATIEKFLSIAESTGLEADIENACIINTELNNRNFIISDKSYIIDWEKPIIGECEQDLGHFLVPTTTNWKTDKILSKKEIEYFLDQYSKYRDFDRIKLNKYMMFNTLRGVTWCSMAKVEYSSEDRALRSDETLVKINKFLSYDFLEYLYENFYKVFDK